MPIAIEELNRANLFSSKLLEVITTYDSNMTNVNTKYHKRLSKYRYRIKMTMVQFSMGFDRGSQTGKISLLAVDKLLPQVTCEVCYLGSGSVTSPTFQPIII